MNLRTDTELDQQAFALDLVRSMFEADPEPDSVKALVGFMGEDLNAGDYLPSIEQTHTACELLVAEGMLRRYGRKSPDMGEQRYAVRDQWLAEKERAFGRAVENMLDEHAGE